LVVKHGNIAFTKVKKEINGIMYVTNDDEDGTIYSYDNEEVGDKVGEFKGLVAHIYNGKNKGIYDRTMCKMNF
jgi:hypothetical protein